MQAGSTAEDYVEVYDEPEHRRCVANEFAYVYSVTLSAAQATLWHRHTEDTIYIALASASGREEFPARDAVVTEIPCGAAVSRPHRNAPLIHKVTNVGDATFRMLGAEALARPAQRHATARDIPAHTLALETPRFRAWRVRCADEAVSPEYACYGLLIPLERSVVTFAPAGAMASVALSAESVAWLEPACALRLPPHFSGFFVEWC